MVIIQMIRIRLKEDSYFTPLYLGAVRGYAVYSPWNVAFLIIFEACSNLSINYNKHG